MRTYTGIWVDTEIGAPSVVDIAVMQGRMCRYNGACDIFWPVLMHSICVRSLCIGNKYPKITELHALLHDAAEVVISDIPRTVKTKEYEELELKILKRIYASLGVPFPTKDEWEIVMEADNRILAAECRAFGPPGILTTSGWSWLGDASDKEADGVVEFYSHIMEIKDVISPDGFFVFNYIKLVNYLINVFRVDEESLDTCKYALI